MNAHAPPECAAAALVYYPDDRPGISRKPCGRGFTYFAPDGTRIDDRQERRRLEALAVPPAYTDVWMCPRPDGHLQATGRDARARKQYRYHPDWTAYRATRKYHQLVPFGEALPRLRRRLDADLASEAGNARFAVAAVVTLMDRLAVRVGNPAYAASNGSYGATTFRSGHVALHDGLIELDYVGKGGRKVRRTLRDKRLMRVLQKLEDLPGAELIDWLDGDGNPHRVSSEQVNAYIADAVEQAHATAKTFRTWSGSLAAFEHALSEERPSIKSLSEAAAARLQNTATIARNSYIHPDVLELRERPLDQRQRLLEATPPVSGLRKGEGAMLAYLVR